MDDIEDLFGPVAAARPCLGSNHEGHDHGEQEGEASASKRQNKTDPKKSGDAVVTLASIEAEDAALLAAKPDAFASMGVADVLATMVAHRGHNGVQLDCLTRLAGLTADEGSFREFFDFQSAKGDGEAGGGGGAPEVILALQQYGVDPRISMYGCLSLGNVFLQLGASLDEAHPGEAFVSDSDTRYATHAVGTALGLLGAHPKNAGALAYAMHLLHGVFSCPFARRMDVIQRGIEGNVLGILTGACELFSRDDFLIQNALLCSLDLATAYAASPADHDLVQLLKDKLDFWEKGQTWAKGMPDCEFLAHLAYRTASDARIAHEAAQSVVEAVSW